MTKKHVIRLAESDLRRIIKESVKNILKESYNDDDDFDILYDDDFDIYDDDFGICYESICDAKINNIIKESVNNILNENTHINDEKLTQEVLTRLQRGENLDSFAKVDHRYMEKLPGRATIEEPRYGSNILSIEYKGKKNVVLPLGNKKYKLMSNIWFDYVNIAMDNFAIVGIGKKWNVLKPDGKILLKNWYPEFHIGFDSKGIAVCPNLMAPEDEREVYYVYTKNRNL